MWALVAGILLAHNAWLWLGKGIVPDTDILALLPVQERDPVLRQSFDRMVDAAQQRVIVLVGAGRWEDAVRAADAYSAVLATRGDLIAASAVDAQTQANWLAPFAAHRSVLIGAQQEAQLRSEAPQFWTDAALGRLYAAFSGPKLGAFRDDPFGLFAGWVQERAGETPVRPRDGHLFVGDASRQYVVLPLLLKAPAFSLAAQQSVLPLLAQASAAARAVHPQADILSAGVILHAAAAASQASDEVHTIGIGSLLGIIVLTWITFGTPRPIGLVLLSIGIGFLGALSVCWLLFGRIHLLTLVFGASLIGVAQDYGIYFLCHRAATPQLDSPALLRRLLPGLALTLLAAVIGYLGLALTPFPGLRHMAVFSATGLLFAWLTVLCWFPALIGPATLRRGAFARAAGASVRRWPRLGRNGASAAVAAMVLLLLVAGGLSLRADDNIRSLQNPPPQLLKEQLALGKLMDAATPVQYFLVHGESAEQLLEREEALKGALDPLVAAGSLRGIQAMSNWVPSARTQEARRQLVKERLLGEPLQAVAAAIGENAAWVAATREHIVDGGQPLTVDAFLAAPASEPWRHLWLGPVQGQFASIVALRGMPYAATARVRAAGAGIDGVQWVDKVEEISSVLGRYRVMMAWVVGGAYLFVFAILLPRYRGRAWRVLAPVAVASGCTLAALALAGQPLQLFHILALMLLLGIGVDYGIFMHEQAGARETPWLAVVVSAVNTVLAFGLLGLSRTPALHAFGLTMLIGTTLVVLLVPCFSKEEHVDATT